MLVQRIGGAPTRPIATQWAVGNGAPAERKIEALFQATTPVIEFPSTRPWIAGPGGWSLFNVSLACIRRISFCPNH